MNGEEEGRFTYFGGSLGALKVEVALELGLKNLQTVNAGEGVEKRESSCTVGGNVN